MYSSFNQTSTASNALRGATTTSIGGSFIQLIKNTFYNLYNFFKLLPQIVSPYFFALFIIGLFIKTKDKTENSFKISSVFMISITLLITAVSIPFFRYLHPVIPIIYIIGVGTLVKIISSNIQKSIFIVLSSLFLVILFGVGQTLGVLILDSRFIKDIHNVSKPHVYVELSKILKDNTNSNQIIITNLDTWGSWYGERKTIWYPIEPKQLIDSTTGKIPFDAIYLTSYLINDQNYYMGESWREIFNYPNDSKKWLCDGCGEIAKEFKLKGIYMVSSNDDYEKQDASAILLVKK
jgi:hypothetical protein